MGFLDRFFGGKPDHNSFAQLVSEAILKAGERRPVHYDPKRFQVVVGQPGDGVHWLYLGNHYEQYCALPRGERDRVITQILGYRETERAPELEREEALRSLLPRLRPASYASLLPMRLRLQVGDATSKVPELPHRLIGEHFAASVCIDFPTTVVDVTSSQLNDWKADFNALFDTAVKNLRALSTEPMKQIQPGLFVSPWRDSHDPARLLLTDMVRGLPLKGAPVAGMPNRDMLILTGADDAQGLSELVTLMKLGLKDPRPLSGITLTLTGDGWVPFSGGAVRSQLRMLAMQALADAHAEQQDVLLKWNEQVGDDTYVAKFNVYEKQTTGELFSVAAWTKTVTTLLPKTDAVSLVELKSEQPGDSDVSLVTWSSLQEVCGHLLKPQPGYPLRWRVDGFPTPEEIARLEPA